MAAEAQAFMSASHVAGKAKGFVSPPVLYCTSLTSVSLIRNYTLLCGQEGKDLKPFNWPHCPGALTAGKGNIQSHLTASATQILALMPSLFFLFKTH